MKADNEMGVPAQDPRKRPKVRCDSQQIAQKVNNNNTLFKIRDCWVCTYIKIKLIL